MHIPPAFRRWGVRLALAVVIAIAIGYLPGQVLRRDPRAVKLEAQLAQLVAEAREVAARNAALRRDIAALRSDIGAIEDRARVDLGMVYPDEIVLRLPHEQALQEQALQEQAPQKPVPQELP
jgi:outer membrane murein-binding lipoprotein Lpp